ncbi:hypothetical protein ALC62_05515 [Cyphomyrmex costatus]|uniref:Uncharacterized protein n=1 Tax=Cyphomyrmex costatus TaxID=456900 RepID=A0A195CU34_9HYME|nr:hypothetical protein ALC62_05515 [Cyphomyrmex costatus]
MKVSMMLQDAGDSPEGKLLGTYSYKREHVLKSGPPCVKIMAALHYVTTIRKHLSLKDFSERNVTKVSLSTTTINSTSSRVTRQRIIRNLYFPRDLHFIATKLYHNFILLCVIVRAT